MPYSRAASTAPSTVSPGARSPPMASRATRTVSLMTDLSFRFTNGGFDQFYEFLQVEWFIHDMHNASLTELRFLVSRGQKGCYDDDWNFIIDPHGHKFEFVATIQIGHHQVEQNEIWLVFAHSIVEAQALSGHICFIAFVCQCLRQQVSNCW